MEGVTFTILAENKPKISTASPRTPNISPFVFIKYQENAQIIFEAIILVLLILLSTPTYELLSLYSSEHV